MEPKIQHTLANLAIEPPQGSWEILSARLDTEYDQPEIQLAQRMNDITLAPPAGAWAAIAAGLPFIEEEKTVVKQPAPARVVSFPIRKAAIAAAVLIAVSFASWFLLRPGTGSIPLVQNNVAPGNVQATTPSSSPNSIAQPPAIAQELPIASPRPLPVGVSDNKIENNDVTAEHYIEQPDLPSANPLLVRAQDIAPTVSIPNRAFRDKSGKVVMDMNLLNTPGTQYVTVTAPNGEQTRISRKFLPVLTFMNTGADNGQVNSSLKQKFQELRKQLLQQASFVPSPTNFLDIMELKELLQDK